MKICLIGEPFSGKTVAINYLKKNGYCTLIFEDYFYSQCQNNGKFYKKIKKVYGDKFVNKKNVNFPLLIKFSNNKKNNNKLISIIKFFVKQTILNLNKKKDWFIETNLYINCPIFFKNCFDKFILIFTKKKWKKNKCSFQKKYLKKISTYVVDKYNEKYKKTNLKCNTYCLKPKINVDIFVNNSKNKNIFKKNILKISSTLNKCL